MRGWSQRQMFILPGILLVALLLRIGLLLAGVVRFDSDEAVVGLMARHILQGARPVFFYGQAYMGSLDAWLIACLFALVGPAMWAIRAVQIGLFLIHVALTYSLARRWSGDETTARLASLLTAVPPVVVTLYTTLSLGGYVETLVLGDLLLIIGWGLATDRRGSVGWWAAWGTLAGLGFWTLGLTVVYALPVGVLLLWRNRMGGWRGYIAAGLGFAAGSSPWWVYNVREAWEAVHVLYDPTGPIDPMAPILPIGLRAMGLFLLGLPGLAGMRLPWSPRWVFPPAIPALAGFYAAAAWHAARGARNRSWHGAYRLLWGMFLTFGAAFVFSRFGSDPTGRYLLPLYTPMALLGAAALAALGRRARWGAVALTGLLLTFHLWGTWEGASSAEGFTAQYNPQLQYGNAHDAQLISFLQEHGSRGYTHYWIAYKIAFLSGERVVLAPGLPHKASLRLTLADDRYPRYGDLVAEASEVVYVTGNQPELDELLRTRFTDRDVGYQERVIGPYHVFYDLTSKVTPSELDPRW